MPNRIIKETLCSSEKLAALSDFEFRLWIGLILQADDYGRGDARPAIIKGHVFPLRERLPLKDIENSLANLAAAGCVSLYAVDGRPYFQFPNWSQHQRIRNAKPKFPQPVADIRGDSPQVAASCGPIQSNPNPIQSNPAERAQEAAARPAFDTVEVYASSNLDHLSPSNMDELVSFLDDLPEEVVRYAIDEACANGARKYAYVRSILNRYMEQGLKSVGAIKAADERKKRDNQPAQQPSPPPARKVREFR